MQVAQGGPFLCESRSFDVNNIEQYRWLDYYYFYRISKHFEEPRINKLNRPT